MSPRGGRPCEVAHSVARADLLLNLVDAANRGDTLMLRRSVEALAAEERSKNHHVLAKQLSARIERCEPVVPKQLSSTVSTHLWYERSPRLRIEDLILSPKLQASILQIVEEQHRADLLRSHGLEPRNRILLTGPPGNGKTVLAEAIAEALMVSLIIPRYESIVGSYLGETSQRLRELFEYVSTRRCVLFFDEFDTVGKERADVHETGEIKRVVSSLLLQIDDLPSHVVVIAATNHPELLDRAVKRRFQYRAEMQQPSPKQIAEWFQIFGRRFGVDFGRETALLQQHFHDANFSDLEDFGLDVLRRFVLAAPGANLHAMIRRDLDGKSDKIVRAQRSHVGKKNTETNRRTPL